MNLVGPKFIMRILYNHVTENISANCQDPTHHVAKLIKKNNCIKKLQYIYIYIYIYVCIHTHTHTSSILQHHICPPVTTTATMHKILIDYAITVDIKIQICIQLGSGHLTFLWCNLYLLIFSPFSFIFFFKQ